jgi:hypothetical protein
MRRESLRDMCREAGIWRSGNKRALAAGLINWRDRCRARGKAFLTEMQSVSKSKPQQLTLRFLAGHFNANKLLPRAGVGLGLGTGSRRRSAPRAACAAVLLLTLDRSR